MNLTLTRGGGSYWVVPQVKRFGCLVAALAIGLGAAACSSSESAVDNGSGFVQSKPGYSEVSVAKRSAAPALEGTTLTNEKLALSSLKGKVVVVNFWGSWCAPCRAESAALESVAKSTAASGVTFVGVAERDTKSNASSFVKGHGVTYPSILDDDGTLAAPWPGATGPPYTFIIDRQGRVAARFLGGVTTEDLQSAVMKVTAEA
ncbi:MAG: putative secreted protein [Mycobacterium sp.]|nr:putative secreted protein [Mycobacterium sp.]